MFLVFIPNTLHLFIKLIGKLMSISIRVDDSFVCLRVVLDANGVVVVSDQVVVEL